MICVHVTKASGLVRKPDSRKKGSVSSLAGAVSWVRGSLLVALLLDVPFVSFLLVVLPLLPLVKAPQSVSVFY